MLHVDGATRKNYHNETPGQKKFRRFERNYRSMEHSDVAEKAFPIKYVVDTSLRGLPQKAFPIKYVVDTSLRGFRNTTKGPWERLGKPPRKPWGRLGGP